MPAPDGSSWPLMVAGLAGGIALLFFGLEQLTSALREVAGDRLRTLLARATSNRWKAAITGAITTAVVQSSSATTVLVVGFVSAGLMSFVGSLGVILGSNIGTTVTAQVVAFDVVEWALAVVAVGFLVMVFAREERLEGWGRAILSLGLVLVGMGAMSSSMAPLRDHPATSELLSGLANPALGALVGAGFTALVQSSSATTVLAIVLASEGLLTLEAGVAVVIGANVGTSVKAILAAIGRSTDAKRAATAHVLFNTVGAFIWLVLLGPLASIATAISPGYPLLTGTERVAAEVPRQLANAHTIFNVANVAIFIWFLGPISALLRRLVPDRIVPPPVSEPRYLDPELLGTPNLALAAVQREVSRLGELVIDMLRRAPGAVFRGPRSALDHLQESDNDVDLLYDSVIGYLARVSEEKLGEHDGRRLLALLETANALESIADLVETNLVSLGHRRLDTGVAPSESTRSLFEDLFGTVISTLDDARICIVDEDEAAARRVEAGRRELNRRLAGLRVRQAGRLTGSERDRRIMYAIEIDVIDIVKRIEYLARRIVRTTHPEEDTHDGSSSDQSE